MNEGAKIIPQREDAALNLRVRILQRWTRDGEWMQVGVQWNRWFKKLKVKMDQFQGSVAKMLFGS
jgi:hypothetical protein